MKNNPITESLIRAIFELEKSDVCRAGVIRWAACGEKNEFNNLIGQLATLADYSRRWTEGDLP